MIMNQKRSLRHYDKQNSIQSEKSIKYEKYKRTKKTIWVFFLFFFGWFICSQPCFFQALADVVGTFTSGQLESTLIATSEG